MRPSSMSRITAAPMSGAASAKRPSSVLTIDQKPRNRLPVVNRLGRIERRGGNAARARSAAPRERRRRRGGPGLVRLRGEPRPPAAPCELLHPVLQLELLLLQGGFLDLLVVAQDGLLGQFAQPALVLMVLLRELAILVVALHARGRDRFLRHRRLLQGLRGDPRVGFQSCIGGGWGCIHAPETDAGTLGTISSRRIAAVDQRASEHEGVLARLDVVVLAHAEPHEAEIRVERARCGVRGPHLQQRPARSGRGAPSKPRFEQETAEPAPPFTRGARRGSGSRAPPPPAGTRTRRARPRGLRARARRRAPRGSLGDELCLVPRVQRRFTLECDERLDVRGRGPAQEDGAAHVREGQTEAPRR